MRIFTPLPIETVRVVVIRYAVQDTLSTLTSRSTVSRRGNNPRCNSIRNVTSTDSLEWNLYSANLWVKFHEDRSSINRTNNEIEIVRGGDREIEGEEERGRDYFEEGTIGK